MVNFDMEEQEIVQLKQAIDLNNQRILEIGCGDGRFTKQLAENCGEKGEVVAIELDPEVVSETQDKISLPNVTIQQASSISLPFVDNSFDIAIFSLSLCCVEPEEDMRTAIKEAIRVLQPSGYLVNMMPSTLRNFDAGFLWYYVDQSDMRQVFDTSVAAARMALKQMTFNEQYLTFVEERRVSTRWSYETIEELREKWHSRYDTAIPSPDPDHRKRFENQLETYLETIPLEFEILEEMQILQKKSTVSE